MKRFFSVLLVAILVVTCLSTVAFAAEVVKTGDVRSFYVSVSGDEFSTYKVSVNVGAGLELVSIEAPYVYGTNVGFMNGGNNVTSHSFKVTVKVTATEPGTYSVSASVVDAGKTVTLEDGTKQIVPVSLSASGASFKIECDHKFGDWTVVKAADCHNEGLEKRVCSICGHEETRVLPKLDHVWGKGYSKDNAGHWHVCELCGDESAHENHFWAWIIDQKPDFETQTDGLKHKHCHTCGHNWDYTAIDWREDPEGSDKVFDLTSVVYGAVAMVSMVASAAYVTKRKSV